QSPDLRPMSGPESGSAAPEGLLAELYEELRSLAAHHLRGERAGHTLQPTALVHEVFLRMQGRDGLSVTRRTHFMAVASIAMRRVLVDHARARAAEQRHHRGPHRGRARRGRRAGEAGGRGPEG